MPLFSRHGAYSALHIDNVELPGPKLIWGGRLPEKVKFFDWLIHFDRINSSANLMYWKNIRPLKDSFQAWTKKTKAEHQTRNRPRPRPKELKF
jgi:hypothetical protein